MISDEDKKDIQKLMLDAIQEVVIPAMDSMNNSLSKRMDKGNSMLADRIDIVETRLGQMDRKLDHVLDKVLDHDEKLKNHEKRMVKIEQLAAVS